MSEETRQDSVDPPSGRGWRRLPSALSLPEVHGSIPIPEGAGFWRKMLAFAGPGYLVAVGYMDPGNWGTNIAGGAEFGYALLWVIWMASGMAMLFQYLSGKLGLAGYSLPEIVKIKLKNKNNCNKITLTG